MLVLLAHSGAFFNLFGSGRDLLTVNFGWPLTRSYDVVTLALLCLNLFEQFASATDGSIANARLHHEYDEIVGTNPHPAH